MAGKTKDMTTIALGQQWKLGTQLGSGGFGQVYQARSDAGQAAVVKLIPKEPGASRELLFEELSGVPNIVPIIDSGEWGGHWALVMPEAEKSLRAYLSEMGGSLETQDAVVVLLDVASALAGIEGRVVHRDLKPDNVLFLEGHWCLADFGIARYAEATTAPDTRKFAMTPPYAAPEQWENKRATSATDVYATGIMAFEMITGAAPFLGPTLEDFREQHLGQAPPALAEIPAPLVNLIHECLYKAPEARPTPQNLLSRLKSADRPSPGAAGRLQQAHRREVERQAESARMASVEESEADRREGLSQAARESLSRISNALHAQVVEAAPESGPTEGSQWPCVLDGAQLMISDSCPVTARPEGKYFPPIDVVVYAHIEIRIQPDQHGYEGRSHSLWYCDAQEAGVYRWYETAFMIHPFIPRRGRMDPFALPPGEQSYGALSGITTEYQVPWPFTAVDQGEEQNFMERWMEWFADAAEGRLQHPSTMPERSPKGSWRSS